MITISLTSVILKVYFLQILHDNEHVDHKEKDTALFRLYTHVLLYRYKKIW